MADAGQVKQAIKDEELTVHRGLVLLASLIGGMTVVMMLLSMFFKLPASDNGIVGFMSMGVKAPFEPLKALAIVGGGIFGIFFGEKCWIWIAQLQRKVSPLPVQTVLKRGSVPFAALVAFIPILCLGQGEWLLPWTGFGLLTLGFILLALFEKKDKRKVFFAYPTENEYHPTSLFVHGSVIVLGSGVGWGLQSMPAFQSVADLGLWFALAIGILVWVVNMAIAAVLNLFFSKLTFGQTFLAVALASLALAVMPLQTLGSLSYIQNGQIVATHALPWLFPTLASIAAGGFLIILVLASLNLKNKNIEIAIGWEEVFRAFMLIIAIPILLFSVAYLPMGAAFSNHQLTGAVDPFMEGEALGTAQAIMMGRLPFKEILFRHGFISDALSGLAAMNWFGGSLESYRLMLSLLAPLGLITIYIFAIFCMPWLWAVLFALTLLTGALGIIPYTRFLLPLVGFIFTLFYLQSNRWIILIFSGLLTAGAIIASYTAGVMALAGQSALLLVYLLFGTGEMKKRLLGFLFYLGVALLGLLPWFLYLGMSGSLGAYFENFSWVMTHYGSVFGLPLPGLGASPTFVEFVIFSIPPIVIAAGGLISLKHIITSRQNGMIPWNILILTVIITLYWMRFLNRSDYSFLLETLPLAAMLGAFFLYRLTVGERKLKAAVFLAVAALVLIPQKGHHTLYELANNFGTKNIIHVDGLVKPDSAAFGNTYLPKKQAEQYDALVTYLDEQVGTSDTFFDFSNQPLLYFLVPRRPLTRSLSSVTLATMEQQLETIHELDRIKAKTVIYDGQSSNQAGFDSIPCEIRQYAVSEYLLQRYEPVKKIGSAVVMVPKSSDLSRDDNASQAMKRLTSWHGLPLTWGANSSYQTGQGNSVDSFLASKGKASVSAKGLTVTAKAGQIIVAQGMKKIELTLKAKEGKAQSGNVLSLKLTLSPACDGKIAKLIWGNEKKGEALTFTLKGDNKAHHYAFRVGALPSWVYKDTIPTIKLQIPGGGWQWHELVVLHVKDIPELK